MNTLSAIAITPMQAEQVEKLLFNRIELVKLLDDITCNSAKIVIQIKSAKHPGKIFPVTKSVHEVMLHAAINELDSKLAILGINIVKIAK